MNGDYFKAKKEHYKCCNCKHYEGNCGHHFKDSFGHINYDCPEESEYDNRCAWDGPACFEPNETLIKAERESLIRSILYDDKYTIEILEEAIVRKSDLMSKEKSE